MTRFMFTLLCFLLVCPTLSDVSAEKHNVQSCLTRKINSIRTYIVGNPPSPFIDRWVRVRHDMEEQICRRYNNNKPAMKACEIGSGILDELSKSQCGDDGLISTAIQACSIFVSSTFSLLEQICIKYR